MRTTDLLGLLVGDRQSILNIARSPRAIWVGLLLVFSAAMAREYDQHWLVSDWWHLLLPFGVSIVMALVQFSVFRLKTPSPPQTSFMEAFRPFLTCFWMTAPLAWLYAIPYERFLTEEGSAMANLYTLLAVSVARGLIICRILQILSGVKFLFAFFVSLGLGWAMMLAAIMFMPMPIIDMMSGTRYTPADQFMVNATIYFVTATVSVGWIAGLLAIAGLICAKPVWAKETLQPSGRDPSFGTWALPVIVSVGLLACLPFTQPPLNRAHQADQLMANDRIDEALTYMDRHSREDFPRFWRPLPHPAWGIKQPGFFSVLAKASAFPSESWVREYYVQEFEQEFLELRRAYLLDSDWIEIQRWLQQLPEGPELRQKNRETIEYFEDRFGTQTPFSAPAATTQPTP